MLNSIEIWQLIGIVTRVQKRRFSNFFIMGNLEILGVIKYLYKKGLSDKKFIMIW